MDALQRLVDIEEIKQLKARYWRCIDTKSFDELATVFAEDAVFDFRQAVRDPVSGTPDGVTEQPPLSEQPRLQLARQKPPAVPQAAATSARGPELPEQPAPRASNTNIEEATKTRRSIESNITRAPRGGTHGEREASASERGP